MVWSRCGRRLFLQPSISCSTSRSVRYSRVLTSPFLGRRGVTFRISVLGALLGGLVLTWFVVLSLQRLSVFEPKNGRFESNGTGIFLDKKEFRPVVNRQLEGGQASARGRCVMSWVIRWFRAGANQALLRRSFLIRAFCPR